MNDGRFTALIAGVILHYIIIVSVGMGLCGWKFVESLVDGTAILLIVGGIVATGLIAPAVWVCMILGALGCFNIYMVVPIITAFGVSVCLFSEG